MESHIKKSLKDLPGIKEIRGKGLMIGLELGFPIKKLRESLTFEHNIFTGNSANPNVFRLLPPLSVSQEELDEFIKVFTHIWPEYLTEFGKQKMHSS
jgi:acetylornithine aminotransferase